MSATAFRTFCWPMAVASGTVTPPRSECAPGRRRKVIGPPSHVH